MIPHIITINKKDNLDVVIDQFATQLSIKPSHRIIIVPEKDELTVEQIHLMQKDIQVAFSNTVLVALMGVDNSSIEVQNSLLKSLEEDAERIQFVLLVHSPNRLLSTILSRCSLVDGELTKSVRKNEHSQSVNELFSFQNNSDATKDEAIERIDTYIESAALKSTKILHHILTMRKRIIDNNVNPVLALDNILIFLSKTSTINIIHEK